MPAAFQTELNWSLTHRKAEYRYVEMYLTSGQILYPSSLAPEADGANGLFVPFWWNGDLGQYHIIIQYQMYILGCGPGSVVGIATGYGLDGPGIESLRFSAPVQTGPGAHPASCKMGTGFFPGVKCGRGVVLTTHPLLVPRSWKSRAIPLSTLWVTPGL